MDPLQNKQDAVFLHKVILDRIDVFTQTYDRFMKLINNQHTDRMLALQNQARILCMDMGLIQEQLCADLNDIPQGSDTMCTTFCRAEQCVHGMKELLLSLQCRS